MVVTFKFKFEKELKQYLVDNFENYFKAKYITSEFRVSCGYIDLIGEDNNTIYLIEVKRDYVDNHTIEQLSKYISEYKTDKSVVGIAAAPNIKEVDITSNQNIVVVKLDGVEYNNERTPICTTIEKPLIDTLRLLSEETRINMNLLLDEAIADLLQKYGKVLGPGE